MASLFANSGVPNQTPISAASDEGLHCLPMTLLGVSRLQWVKPGMFIFLHKCFIMLCSLYALPS